MPDQSATTTCERHGTTLLDRRKVDALITLFDWPHATIEHACEQELIIKNKE